MPLDIKSAIAPYRGRRRISLRIEGMPQSARLSAGTNNGNGTWSLALDELEDLSYLPPGEADIDHALRLRIVSREDDFASTVALLDLPCTMAPSVGQPAGRPQAFERDVGTSVKTGSFQKKCGLKLMHVADLENENRHETRVAADEVKDRIARELASARARWQAELDQRVETTIAEAAINLQHHQMVWTSEQDRRVADEQSRMAASAAGAIEAARREARAEASQAAEEWHYGESAKLADLESQWRTEVQEAQKQGDIRLATLIRQAEAERDELLGELQAARDKLSKFEAAEKSGDEESTKLARIETSWRTKAQEAKNQSDARLAAVIQQTGAERGHLLRELQAAKDELSKSESVLLTANLAVAKRDKNWEMRLATVLSEAKILWATLEAKRLKEAEARLLAQFEQTLAEKTGALPILPNAATCNVIATPDSKEVIEALESQLEARDIALAQLRTLCEKDMAANQTIFRDAQGAWRLAEAERLKSAEAKWQADAAASRASYAARCEALELELAQTRSTGGFGCSSDAHIAKLNRDVKVLRETVADREGALALVHASFEKFRRMPRTDILSDRSSFPKMPKIKPPAENVHKKDHIVRDVIILMAVVMVAILCFPTIESFLPHGFNSPVDSNIGVPHTDRKTPNVHSKDKTLLPSSENPKATTIRATNLRVGPLPFAPIVTRLKAGVKGMVIEKRGHWERINVLDGQSKPAEGWVYDTNMHDAPIPPSTNLDIVQ